MPEWVQRDIKPLRELYHSSLSHRLEMFNAENDEDAQNRLREFAREWDIARNTITLSEAEQRWRKTNLRQTDLIYKWKSGGTWLTTTYIMERAYGPEHNE